jgi:hypothetical protein
MDYKLIIEQLANEKKWQEILDIFKSPPALEPFIIKSFYLHSLYNINKQSFISVVNHILSSPNEYDEIIFHLLNYKFFDTCYDLIKIGLSLFPKNPYLHFKNSICCFYVNKFNEGMLSTDLLLLNRSTPDYIYNNCLNNLDFYIHSPIINKRRITDVPVLYPYRPMNMTLLRRKEHYLSIIRAVNYIIDSTGRFMYEGNLTSLTTMVTFSPSLKQTYMKEISQSNVQKYNSQIVGLEDCRFIDSKLLIATSAEYNKYSIPQMVLVRLFDTFDISSIHPIFYENETLCQKNWIPLPNLRHTDKILKFIYTFDPFVIISVDTDNNYKSSFHEKIDYSISFRELRGSSTFIEYDNGYLILLHYSKNCVPRIYYHRLCWFSKDFENGKISSSFYFESKQIEYCTGMCLTHDEKNLLFSYSINDDKTSFGLLPIELLNSILHLSFNKI